MARQSALQATRGNAQARALCSTRHLWGTAGIVSGLMMLACEAGFGQEALRTSLATAAAIGPHQMDLENLPYTFKTGDLRLRVTPSLGIDWNDNVNAAKDNPEDDFILRPMLGFNLSLPVTERNLLQLNVNFGYDKYFRHDELSTWRIGSDSVLSFDIFIKDFQINLHDRFNYVQDSAQEAGVAGTGKYGEIYNTVGLLTSWSLKDVNFSLGYDHQTTISPASEFSSNDRSSELFVGRTGYQFEPTITAGVEGTAALTRYNQAVLNDNNNYSAGVYGDWQPGSYLHVSARGGYTITEFQATSGSIRTKDLNSWYADVTITHAVTKAISYGMSVGHEVRLGVQTADAIEDTYVRPTATWSFIRDWPFR